jgi:hypothetical protein
MVNKLIRRNYWNQKYEYMCRVDCKDEPSKADTPTTPLLHTAPHSPPPPHTLTHSQTHTHTHKHALTLTLTHIYSNIQYAYDTH